MRRAGVADPDDVQGIILEPHGDYSVIQGGSPLSRDLFAHVVGADRYLFTSED